jgi:hypothetical protein
MIGVGLLANFTEERWFSLAKTELAKGQLADRLRLSDRSISVSATTEELTLYKKAKVKQFRYTPWRRLGGEEVLLLLILDLGTRWG